MKKLKVLHLIYSFHFGGAEEVIVNYARKYSKDKYEMVVGVLTDGGELVNVVESLGVKVFQLKKKKRLETFFKLRKLIIDEKFDILHLHNPAGSNWGVPASFFTQVSAIVRTEHNVYYEGRVSPNYSMINTVLATFTDKIIACCELVRISQVKNYNVPEYKYVTISNGIDEAKFDIEFDENLYKKELGIPEGAFVVGNVAHLIKQKGHEFFLQMAKEILDKYPNVCFVIVGDGKLRDSLINLSRDLRVKSKVIFAGVRKDIPKLLKIFDVFVLSSLWEGLPIVLLEAMASGVPILATDVGGNSEAVENGVTGYLVPAEDPLALAQKVMQLISSKMLRNEMVENSFKRFQERFTASIMVEETELLYEAILKGKGIIGE